MQASRVSWEVVDEWVGPEAEGNRRVSTETADFPEAPISSRDFRSYCRGLVTLLKPLFTTERPHAARCAALAKKILQRAGQ